MPTQLPKGTWSIYVAGRLLFKEAAGYPWRGVADRDADGLALIRTGHGLGHRPADVAPLA